MDNDKKLYGGVLSNVGIVFLVLEVLGLVGLLILMQYDTLIAGADENVIGDTQTAYILLAVAGMVVCGLVVVVDVIRHRAGAKA